MEVFKSALLIISAHGFVMAILPPKRAVGGKGEVYRGQLFERVVRQLCYLGCFLVSASAACHSALLLVYKRRNETLSRVPTTYLCPTPSSLALDLLAAYSPEFVTGLALVVAGTLLRLLSFRALGPLFTYEVSIKDDHSLITTGIYAFIRHPSYTGVAMLLLGTHLIHFGSSGYVTQCGIDTTPLVVFVGIWRTGTIFSVLSLFRRCAIEDSQLHERFGEAWGKYRNDVPYCLLPFVY